MNLSLNARRAIRTWARHEPLVKEVWLFGSRAKGNARDDSDVDVAIRFNADDRDVVALFSNHGRQWQDKLCAETRMRVALAHLAGDEISPTHEAAIRDHGIRLYPQRDKP